VLASLAVCDLACGRELPSLWSEFLRHILRAHRLAVLMRAALNVWLEVGSIDPAEALTAA
jgi:hypothetical protein